MKIVAGIVGSITVASAIALEEGIGWWDGTGMKADAEGCVACHRGDGANTYHCFGAGQCQYAFGNYEGAYEACNAPELSACAPCFPASGAPCADPALIESVKTCDDFCFSQGSEACFQKDMCALYSGGKYQKPGGVALTEEEGFGCNEAIGCSNCYAFVYSFDKSLKCAQCDMSVLTYDLVTGNTNEESKALCQALIDTPGLEASCACLTSLSKSTASGSLNCMPDATTSYSTLMAQRTRCEVEASTTSVSKTLVSFAAELTDEQAATVLDKGCVNFYTAALANDAEFSYDEILCTLTKVTARRLLEGVEYSFDVTALTAGVDEFMADVNEQDFEAMVEAISADLLTVADAAGVETLPPTAPPTEPPTEPPTAMAFSGSAQTTAVAGLGLLLAVSALL